MDNARYNYYKELHPEWSDEQIWTAISIDMQTKVTVENGDNNVDITDPEVISSILRKAGDWLKSVLPHVFEKIGKFIDSAIASVITWAKNGLSYIQELLKNAFN
jgi:hypothetical protein